MVIDMQEERVDSIERLEQFLEGTAGVAPRVAGGEAERQAHLSGPIASALMSNAAGTRAPTGA